MSKYAGNTDNKFLNLPNTTLGTYNAWDAYNTAKLVQPLLEELRDNHQLDFFLSTVEPLQTAVVNMQARGMHLDQIALAKYRTRTRKELDEVENFLCCECGDRKLNPNADDQLRAYLIDKHSIKWSKKTAKTNKPSMSQEALIWMLRNMRKRDEHTIPFIHGLLHRSRLNTILSRYLRLTPDEDGRVRARVKMAKAKTTRFAYDNPAMQQMPPEVRHIFVAKPGHVFLSVDYSQLEAVLQARFSKDQPSIKVFDSGGDIHTANAIDLFNMSEADVNKPVRDYSKAHLYKITYGGEGSDKERTYCICTKWGCDKKNPPMLKLSKADKTKAEARWFIIHHAVRTWQNELGDFVKKHHYYDHPFGGRRYFTSPWSAELEREMKNEPMQRGGAILMARAQIKLDNIGAPIVLQMHDEFISEVKEGELAVWRSRTQGVMETPIPELDNAIIPTDAEWGYNWGAKTSDNLGGMRKF